MIKRIRHQITSYPPITRTLRWLSHQGLGDDVVLASYPRSGSTWLRFLIYDLLQIGSSMFPTVNATIPAVARRYGAPRILPGNRRLLQTHEAYQPQYQTAIWLVRDPRDVVISEYYFEVYSDVFRGSFEQFFEKFLDGKVNRYGDWRAHTASWLAVCSRQPDQVLALHFETLRQETPAVLQQVASFLHIPTDQAQIERAIANNEMAKMRAKEQAAYGESKHGINFVRKGKVSGWRDNLSLAQVEKLEEHVGDLMDQLGYARLHGQASSGA